MTNRPVGQIKLKVKMPLLWLGCLLVAALLLPDPVWNTLLIGIGGLFAASYVWAHFLATGLYAQRRLRFGWVAVGDRFEEQFVLGNASQLPALWVEIRDQSNVPGYQPAVVRSVGFFGEVRWRKAAVCQQRGQYTIGPWQLHSGDPFGIFQIVHDYPISEEIVIHPPIHGRLPIPLPAGQSDGRARAHRRAMQATINASTIRHYRPGDPQRWIHWRSTARHDSLLVREFDLDAAGDVWIFLDLFAPSQLGSGFAGTEEHAVLLAAALTARLLGQNRAVGIASYGKEPQIVPPGQGQGQQWRILQALALVQSSVQTPLARALDDLAQLVQRRAAVLIVTPNHDSDWLPNLLDLSQRGVQAHLVLLDRASFGDSEAVRSQNLQQMVHRLGMACTIIEQGALGDPLQAAERRGFWDFRVTGTGKVIVVNNPLTQSGAASS